jgi:hypothetical protein
LFWVLIAIFICVSLNNFVIFPVSFPLYVKVSHFVFRNYGSVYFVFVGLDIPSASLCAMSADGVVDPVSLEEKVNSELYGVLLEEHIFSFSRAGLWSV